MPTELFANNPTTTLPSGATNVATSLTVASSTGFPAAVTGTSQFRALIGTEIVIVTNVSGTTWTVTRGAESTTAAAHAAGAAVTHIVTKGSLESFQQTDDSGWIAVSSFSGTWINFGSGQPDAAYRKIGNRVTLRGLIKSGTMMTDAFTLPSGYRPASLIRIPAWSNNAFGSVEISTLGTVRPQNGTNVSFALDGVSFLVD